MQAAGLFGTPQPLALPSLLKNTYPALAVILAVVFIYAVILMDRMDPGRRGEAGARPQPKASLFEIVFKREWHWAVGGAVVGLLVLAATAARNYLGMSGALVAFVGHVTALVAPGYITQSNYVGPLDATSAWRAVMIVGVVLGAMGAAWLAGEGKPRAAMNPAWQEAFGPNVLKRLLVLFLGGFLFEFGATIGGGCPTGAFIAGWPTLSVGSFLMGMVFMPVSILTAQILWRGRTASAARAGALAFAAD